MNSRPPASDDDVPMADLRALKNVDPPASLVPAVMRAITEPRTVSFWQWLVRPRRLVLRVTPVGLLALAAVAAVAVYAVDATTSRRRALPGSLAEADGSKSTGPAEVVQVRFVLVAKGARKVGIAGDFNGWNAEGTVLENVDGQGTFVATVPLGHGAHEYMFLVDGKWMTDPAAGETRPDGFGQTNAVLRL